MKVNRDPITKLDLVKALPMGREFTFESVSLDITRPAFNRRLQAFPEMFIDSLSSSRFKIKDGCLTALIAWATAKPKAKKKTGAKPKVRPRDEKADKEQSLHNLFMSA
jgi:hypothetical protein